MDPGGLGETSTWFRPWPVVELIPVWELHRPDSCLFLDLAD